ncbi:hypothetical protein [Bradyrhizobium sp. CCBAU 11361]|uniref:hypothetical protein n=1 Tax=Bradyrhizobium sp. CCBAU 11361 TaxID=1630812 RepID=UPI00230493A4|nr:hypothetical protein [Bradyrhizobium sp. CCBAU 11361]MDA9487637.1 hypothetical protein [Bradyrhizobium sp. CCBAU 11361]
MSETGSSPCPNGGSGPFHKPDLEGIDEHALGTPLQQALQVRLRAGRAADLVHIFNIKIELPTGRQCMANVAHEEKIWQEIVGAKDRAQATRQTRIRELELRQASQPAEKPLGAKERDSS